MIGRAALVAALVAAAGVPAAAEPSTQPPRASTVQILDPGVRVLDPPVRPLTPEIRALRAEVVDGSTTTVTISSDVLFDFDSAALTATARRIVDETGARLATSSGAIDVVGHTDSVGTGEYNQGLSEARASAVAEQLRAAVGGRTITATGRSFLEPVAPNGRNGQDDPAGRALNRRVVITVRG